MTDYRYGAPAKAWLIAVLFVLPMAYPLFTRVSLVEPAGLRGANEYHYRYDLSQFLIEDRAARTGPVGVMLAMSGGSCATVGPVQLSVGGVHMYGAFYPDANAATFDGLTDLLVAGQPDFVVIQDTVLVLDRPQRRYENLSDTYAESRSYWSGQVKGMVRKFAGGTDALDANDEFWRCPALSKQKMIWEEAVQATVRRVDSYSQQRREKPIELLNVFTDANIPVLIVSPPANSYTLGYGLAVHDAAGELVADTPVDAIVSLHRQAELTPIEQFNDPMHLSPAASQHYRDWLNGEIAAVLQGQASE